MSRQQRSSKSLREWHEILGHCNLQDIFALENVVDVMRVTGKKEFDCETCVMGKMTQPRNRKPDTGATMPLELVHCDLAGPIDPIAREGFRYALAFVDDYSGMIMIYFLQNESDTLRATEKFLADLSPYGKVKSIRSDNETEFTSQAFENLLIKHSIKHERSAPYSPHQNGNVERVWRSIFDMARCLLIEAKLHKTLWTYAVMTVVYIRNRCYNHRIKKTPHEAFTKQKPNLQKMHIFGTICYTYVQDKKKLDARGEKGFFLGYDKGSRAYLVYFPESGAIRKIRCVRFTDKFEDSKDVHDNPESNIEEDTTVSLPLYPLDPQPMNDDQNDGNDRPNPTINDGNAQMLETRYPKRDRSKPKYLEHYTDSSEIDESNHVNFTVDYCYKMSEIPQSYQEAISSPRSHEWQKAMEGKMHALRENDTFELTTMPKDKNAVGGRWVYAIKTGPNGEKCKACFVAKGYSQIPNVDYHETFSPTAKMTSIRVLMQLVVQYNLTVHQMDVKPRI